MDIYRIKHIPTGLYVNTSNGSGSQLCKKGKVYHSENRWTTIKRSPNIRIYNGAIMRDIILGRYKEFGYRRLSNCIEINDPSQFQKEILARV